MINYITITGQALIYASPIKLTARTTRCEESIPQGAGGCQDAEEICFRQLRVLRHSWWCHETIFHFYSASPDTDWL